MSQTQLSHAGPKTPRSRRWVLSLLAALGVLTVVLLVGLVLKIVRERSYDQPNHLKLLSETRRIAAERAKPHLDWADAQSLRAIDEHLGSLAVFFGDAKKRTPQFAEDILSFRSKWLLVRDKLPFTRAWHQVFLRERFEARLFTPDQLAQSVELIIKGYTASMQSAEGAMLVKIRADIADLPQGALSQFATKEVLERAFAGAIEDATKKAQVDLRSDVIRELASQIAGEVLTMVAVRLGVSAGILGAGAGSSLPTLGVGLVVGLIVDQLVSWVWKWWTDPVGDLSKMMNDKLDQIHKLIVDGDGAKPGLRAKLLELHEKRKSVRRQAVGDLIEGKAQP